MLADPTNTRRLGGAAGERHLDVGAGGGGRGGNQDRCAQQRRRRSDHRGTQQTSESACVHVPNADISGTEAYRPNSSDPLAQIASGTRISRLQRSHGSTAIGRRHCDISMHFVGLWPKKRIPKGGSTWLSGIHRFRQSLLAHHCEPNVPKMPSLLTPFPGPELARLRDRGLLRRDANGYYIVVPQDMVGCEWTPNLEAAAAGSGRRSRTDPRNPYGHQCCPRSWRHPASPGNCRSRRAWSTQADSAQGPSVVRFVKPDIDRLDAERVETSRRRNVSINRGHTPVWCPRHDSNVRPRD